MRFTIENFSEETISVGLPDQTRSRVKARAIKILRLGGNDKVLPK
jgi:hypothetical protein